LWEIYEGLTLIKTLAKTDDKNTFSPDEVKMILNTDSQEFQHLCREFSINPKRDESTGKTYFSKRDVEILEKIKSIHKKSSKMMDKKQEIDHRKESTALMSTKTAVAKNQNQDMTALIDTMISTRDNIIDKISKIIDEKLDGIDDVVVELIKCKTENERLKQKVNELTKDNYKIKNDLQSFKHLTFGLYVKIAKEENYAVTASEQTKYVNISE